MNDHEIISQILTMESHYESAEAHCRQARKIATGLRKQLEGKPPAGLSRENALSADVIAKVLAKKNKKDIVKRSKFQRA